MTEEDQEQFLQSAKSFKHNSEQNVKINEGNHLVILNVRPLLYKRVRNFISYKFISNTFFARIV